MKTVTLTTDDRRITAREGYNLLWAALDNGIYSPNLCTLRDKPEPACRLRFVEVIGKEQLVTACTEKVAEGMLVNTKGDKALRLQRSALGLLMFSHPRALCPLCQ
jgi:NADH dehydrogenase/NADH:ubiquinone oxidoreductase subunit G